MNHFCHPVVLNMGVQPVATYSHIMWITLYEPLYKTFGYDGFLQDNHIILLMDDTVLVATWREAMHAKVRLLYNSAKEFDMVTHPEKSRFLAVNTGDTLPFGVGNVQITHTSSYVYPGSVISAESITQQVEKHIK